MTHINFKVIGLTQPGFKPTGSELEPAIFRFPDLPGREAGTLLIWPPRLVIESIRYVAIDVTSNQNVLIFIFCFISLDFLR